MDNKNNNLENENNDVVDSKQTEIEPLNENLSDSANSDNGDAKQSSQDNEKKPREFRGLYKHVKISVKTLDIIIIVCIVVIIAVVAFDLATDPGFKVTFDSKGGTDVPSQNHMYGQLLDKFDNPTRERYTFAGWYKDPSYSIKWDMEKDTVTEAITLYAKWEANTKN